MAKMFNRSLSTGQLVDLLKAKLQSFTSSCAQFQVLHTLPEPSALPRIRNERPILYILDSSFNPPTIAHYSIVTSALESDPSQVTKRLLLLLAIQNADKAPKPESFEQRLAMMTVFAQDVLGSHYQSFSRDDLFAVDIGVTKLPYFIDKSKAIAESTENDGQRSVEQVHLIGFDTIKRILDPKYYPPDHNLKCLRDLFENHRFRCTYRIDDSFGRKEEQYAYIHDLASGQRKDEGADSKWAQRIKLVEGRGEGEETVSSTKVREAVERGDRKKLHELCTNDVADWIWFGDLYNPKGKPDPQVQEARRSERRPES